MHVKGLWILIYIETMFYVLVCVCVCVCVCRHVSVRAGMCAHCHFVHISMYDTSSEPINEFTLTI